MRTFSLVITVLLLAASNSTKAADVESADVGMNCQSFGLRITVAASRAYDSPLYEGLIPTTLEMFQASDQQADMPTELNFAWPEIPADDPKIEQQQVVPAGMVIASNDDLHRFQTNNFFNMYNSPLYDGLYSMTINAFKQSDESKGKGIFTFSIAFNR
jgi:hypothetical protein